MDELLQKVLVRCLNGDEQAFGVLIQRFQPRALELAASYLRDRDLAEDAVQEAFLVMFQKLHELRELEAFPGWFRQVVRTQACRMLRTRKDVSGLDEFDPVDPTPTPEKQAELEELRRIVRDALQQMNSAGRQATELFYLDQLSCTEIAQKLQVPEGTVKRRLHDGRKQLRGLLLGTLGEEPETTPDRLKRPFSL